MVVIYLVTIKNRDLHLHYVIDLHGNIIQMYVIDGKQTEVPPGLETDTFV